MAEARVHYEEHYTGQTPWSDVRDLESLGVNMRLHVYVTDLVQAFFIFFDEIIPRTQRL